MDAETGFMKIGFSNKPEVRLRTLRRQPTLLPKPNSFFIYEAWLGTVDDERILHEKFAEYRIRGEWFDLDGERVEQVRKHF
jgi:hypothetical protein